MGVSFASAVQTMALPTFRAGDETSCRFTSRASAIRPVRQSRVMAQHSGERVRLIIAPGGVASIQPTPTLEPEPLFSGRRQSEGNKEVLGLWTGEAECNGSRLFPA